MISKKLLYRNKIVISLIILTVLITVAYFLYETVGQNMFGVQNPQTVLTRLNKIIPDKASRTEVEKRHLIWLRSDGKRMSIKGYGFELAFLDKPVADDYVSRITSTLEILGFTQNKENSRTTLYTEKESIEILGFEKGAIKCLIRSSSGALLVEGVDEYVYWVSCANRNAQSEKEFEAFYPVINEGDNPSTVVTVFENNESFATGGIHDENQYSGANWIAKNENGVWVKVYEGQDWPPCSVIKNIPKEFYNRCWDGNQLIQ